MVPEDHHIPVGSGAPSPRRRTGQTVKAALADALPWLAGVHPATLRESDSDKPFYGALGAMVLVLAVVSGLLMMTTVSYVTQEQHAWDLWWVAVIWTLVMIAIERLALQISRGRWYALLITGLLRLALSILIAVNVAEVAGLVAFKGEIENQMSKERVAEIRDASREVSDTYDGKISAAKGEITRLKANERKVEQRIAREELARDEARDGGACIDRCAYYDRLVQGDQELLATMRSRNAGRFAGRRAELRRLREERRTSRKDRQQAILKRDGLLARSEALATLQKESDAVDQRVWLFRGLLVVLDLFAFGAKLARVLTVKNGAYETNLDGRRAEEALLGEQRLERARVERARLQDDGRAARRRNRAHADAGIFGYIEPDNSFATDYVAMPQTGAPIEGYGLADFTAGMDEEGPWERRPIEVPSTLRRGGFVGLALLAATLAAGGAIGVHGLVLPIAAFLAATGLFAVTRGFRRAPSWQLRGILGTFFAGVAAPVLLLLLNV